MSDTKFTPGPWVAGPFARIWANYGEWFEGNAGARSVASITRDEATSQDEAVANAHLIAAAPALYEALEEARERMMGGSPAIRALIEKTDAALSLARGER